jgi:hypothetical protein
MKEKTLAITARALFYMNTQKREKYATDIGLLEKSKRKKAIMGKQPLAITARII